MLDTIKDLLASQILFIAPYLFIACATGLIMTLSTTPPYGYLTFWVPLSPLLLLIIREELRRSKHTYAYGKAKQGQVTQENRDLALEYWIRESKKNKQLP